MSFAEALAQAFKLFVTVVSYAFDQAKEREARIDDWQKRQEAFEKIVAQAMLDMRARAALEHGQVDATDDAVDKLEVEAPPHGQTANRVDDLQQRTDDPGGTRPPT